MNGCFWNRIIWGFILIAAGIMFLLQQQGLISFHPGEIASTYWPVILIFYGLKGFIAHKQYQTWGGGFIWNLLLAAMGVFFLTKNLGLNEFEMDDFGRFIFPILLIAVGLSILLKPRKVKHSEEDRERESRSYSPPVPQAPPIPPFPPVPPVPPLDDFLDKEGQEPKHEKSYSAHWHHDIPKHKDKYHHETARKAVNKSNFIGDVHIGHDVWQLEPMNISHFIGDTILDLTRAHIPLGETKITVSAFIGDVKVLVPNDLDVEISVVSSSFLGDNVVFDRREGGMFKHIKAESSAYSLAERRIRLIVSVFIGDLRVQRVG